METRLMKAAKAVMKAFIEGHAGEEFDGEFSRVMAELQAATHEDEKGERKMINKAHKGLGVDIWLSNVIKYSMDVWCTEYAKTEMTKADREALYEIHVQAKRIHQKYVEE